ncbi:MAG: response regulator [Firmicutes bacterium]|nr:response regulator [Bacillota bacterium]
MKTYTAHTKAIRILIATGDPNLKADLKERIQNNPSFKVAGTAQNGVEALMRAGELTPVLVLMDMKMPEAITGAQMIKAGFPNIRILILGVKGKEELTEALKSGADGYLIGAVETRELIAALKNTILGISVNNDFLYIP